MVENFEKEQTASKSSVAYHSYPHYSPLFPMIPHYSPLFPITPLVHPYYIPITSLLHPYYIPVILQHYVVFFTHISSGNETWLAGQSHYIPYPHDIPIVLQVHYSSFRSFSGLIPYITIPFEYT